MIWDLSSALYKTLSIWRRRRAVWHRTFSVSLTTSVAVNNSITLRKLYCGMQEICSRTSVSEIWAACRSPYFLLWRSAPGAQMPPGELKPATLPVCSKNHISETLLHRLVRIVAACIFSEAATLILILMVRKPVCNSLVILLATRISMPS